MYVPGTQAWKISGEDEMWVYATVILSGRLNIAPNTGYITDSCYPEQLIALSPYL